MEPDKAEKKDGEIDPRFWDVLMSADKKDYENICIEFGVTNYRWMLKTLNAKKVEREEEKAKFVEKLGNLKHIEVTPGGGAEFELELSLKDPNVKVFLFKIHWVGKNQPCEQGKKFDIEVSEDMLIHRLVIKDCEKLDGGIYSASAGIKSCNAFLVVEDPGVHFTCGLSDIRVIMDESAELECKLSSETCKGVWYKDGEEIKASDHAETIHDGAFHRLILKNCTEEDSGTYRFEADGRKTEAMCTVEDRPSPPLGPVEIIEASSAALEFKWRPPKDEGGCPVINYLLERQQLGRNSWMKHGLIPGEAKYRDTNIDHGRKYCYHIRAVTEQGISEVMETDDIQAGTRAYPGQLSPPKVISALANCINLEWSPPSNTGGTDIVGYHLEKRKKGSNLWGSINHMNAPIKGQAFAVKDVIEGMEYEFRVAAINASGAGETSIPSEFVIARDPKSNKLFSACNVFGSSEPPGQVIDLKVTDSTYTTLSLGWTKPKEEEGVQDEAKGYFVELRPATNPEWGRCNNNPINMTSYHILGLKAMDMYWASPMPQITWLKDGMPVPKRVTISNSDITSQLLITTSERQDTGVYTIIIKNMVGQVTFSVEIRVTDDPKATGPVEVNQNVPGTLTVTWTSSPDEKRDDRLYYIVSMRDSVKRMWQTVADRLFNNKFTALNIMAGREYYFRVYAKNDMGLSEPSESPVWGITKKKDKLSMTFTSSKNCSFETAPSFLVPLKTHSSPESYECYMSCAVTGIPTPHVTWYRNNVSLNTNTNYLITNTCGVCSMVILRVGAKDSGEYKVVADNSLGRAECSTNLTVKGQEIAHGGPCACFQRGRDKAKELSITKVCPK
ncbi:hypothetical protein DPEC_G00209940 [Dallia pectoralis]|uniref:Uncharacterized protein n=1 Tax=Dallia pectoralis TaxID=75939 RepID=A0ACC2G5Q9_DALPE|nr:hypothetical protein DPEC_G00209940 [Dallia pectoralis]